MADIGLAAIPILLIGNTAPHDILTKRKPTRHLFSFIPMLSLVSFLFFQTLAYIFIWFYVRAQPWFVEYQFVQDLFPPNASYEQTNVFLYASAASVIGAIVFSKGAPYRKPLYSNGIQLTYLKSIHCHTFISSHHGYLGSGWVRHCHLHVTLQLTRLRHQTQFQDSSSY